MIDIALLTHAFAKHSRPEWRFSTIGAKRVGSLMQHLQLRNVKKHHLQHSSTIFGLPPHRFKLVGGSQTSGSNSKRRDLMMRRLFPKDLAWFLKLVFSMIERFDSILLVILEQWTNGDTLLQNQGHQVMCSGKQHLGEFVNAGALSALVCCSQTYQTYPCCKIEQNHPRPPWGYHVYSTKLIQLPPWGNLEISWKKTSPKNTPTAKYMMRNSFSAAAWISIAVGEGNPEKYLEKSPTSNCSNTINFPCQVWISGPWRMWSQIHPVSWSKVQLRSDAAMAWYYSWDPMSLSWIYRSMKNPDFKEQTCHFSPFFFGGGWSGFCTNFHNFWRVANSRIENA